MNAHEALAALARCAVARYGEPLGTNGSALAGPSTIRLPDREPVSFASDGACAAIIPADLGFAPLADRNLDRGMTREIVSMHFGIPEHYREREILLSSLIAWCGDPVWSGPGACPDCDGPSAGPVACSECGGSGECSKCGGECAECDGSGIESSACFSCDGSGRAENTLPRMEEAILAPGANVDRHVVARAVAAAFASATDHTVTVCFPAVRAGETLSEPIAIRSEHGTAIVMPIRPLRENGVAVPLFAGVDA